MSPHAKTSHEGFSISVRRYRARCEVQLTSDGVRFRNSRWILFFMSILDPRARDMIHTFTKLLQMQLAAPEQTAVVHSNLIRSVGGSSARDCRHRRPMAAAEWRGNGFTDARANGASPFKLGGVLLSKFGCLLTSVYMFNVSHRGVTLSTHVCQSVSLSTRPPLDLRFWWSELGVMWSSYLLSLNNVHTTHSS